MYLYRLYTIFIFVILKENFDFAIEQIQLILQLA